MARNSRKTPKVLKASVPYGWNRALGDVLRSIRIAKEISIEDAEHKSGFHRESLRQWERGDNCRLDSFCLYCFTLGVKPSDVMKKAGL